MPRSVTNAAIESSPAKVNRQSDLLPTGIKRYNRMLYTIGTANFTVAAKFTAGIVRGLVDQKFAGL